MVAAVTKSQKIRDLIFWPKKYILENFGHRQKQPNFAGCRLPTANESKTCGFHIFLHDFANMPKHPRFSRILSSRRLRPATPPKTSKCAFLAQFRGSLKIPPNIPVLGDFAKIVENDTVWGDFESTAQSPSPMIVLKTFFTKNSRIVSFSL